MNKQAAAYLCMLTAFASIHGYADLRITHCPIGCPSSPEGNALVVNHIYTFSNNHHTKFPDWVAYEVNVLNFGKSPGRNWAANDLLDPGETLEEEDYRGAHGSDLNINRGHLVPLAAFSSSDYWYEVNYLSNITPQRADLNQGPWEKLEEAVRNSVVYGETRYVYAGPVYWGERVEMPNSDESHDVPDAFFKIVYDLNGNYVAFYMTQDSERTDGYCSKIKPIEFIKRKTGLEFDALKRNAVIAEKLDC